jgi:hypothetical protein
VAVSNQIVLERPRRNAHVQQEFHESPAVVIRSLTCSPARVRCAYARQA